MRHYIKNMTFRSTTLIGMIVTCMDDLQIGGSNVFNTKAAMAATTNGRNTLFNTKAAAALEATSGSSVSKGATSGSSKQQAEQWQQRSDKQSSGSNKWKQCKFLRTNDP